MTVRSRPSKGAAKATVAILIPLVMWLAQERQVNIYDEGLLLTGALRVAAGEFPHRDFYANYAPGQFEVLAWLFAVLGGPSLAVARAYDALTRALVLFFCWRLLRPYTDARARLLTLGSLASWLASWPSPNYPVWPSMVMMLVGIEALLRAHSQGQPAGRRWLMVSGLSFGAIGWFRYDVAVFAVGAGALAQLVVARSGTQMRARLVDLSLLLASAAMAVAPLLMWMVDRGAFADLWQQVVDFQGRFYAASRNLPMPKPWRTYDLSVYLPFIVAATAAGLWRAGDGTNAVDAPSRRAALLFGSFALCMLPKGLVRVSSLHMALAIVPALLFLPVAWRLYRASQHNSVNAGWRAGLWVCLAVAGLSTVAALGRAAGETSRNTATLLGLRSEDVRWVGVSKVTGRSGDAWNLMDADAAAAATLVQKLTPADEPIFSGTGRHDRIFINDVSFYFLAHRLPGTKWHHFDPHLQNSPEVQARMIEELDRHHVRYVVLTDEWDASQEPNDSSISTGALAFDRYLRSRFVLIAPFGHYTVWQRRSNID